MGLFVQIATVQQVEGSGIREALSKPKPKKRPSVMSLTEQGQRCVFKIQHDKYTWCPY